VGSTCRVIERLLIIVPAVTHQADEVDIVLQANALAIVLDQVAGYNYVAATIEGISN
jgi:hypothetical protein